MNKKELVAAIATKANMTQKEADKVINLFIDEVSNCLANGEKVQLIGFGTFETRRRAARDGKNPRTGKSIKIDECRLPAFKAGKQLKNKVK